MRYATERGREAARRWREVIRRVVVTVRLGEPVRVSEVSDSWERVGEAVVYGRQVHAQITEWRQDGDARVSVRVVGGAECEVHGVPLEVADAAVAWALGGLARFESMRGAFS